MLNKSTSEYNSWDENRKKLKKIIGLLKTQNLDPKAGSRLYRYDKILNALLNGKSKDLPIDFNDKKFHQISTEIYQLYYGIVELSKSNTFNEWAPKIKFLISGNELPEDDQDFTPRNYQFELYIAGLLKKSGLEPLCAEPDIQINQNGRNFGIAIKRPNSIGKLDENLRKARKQIVHTKLPGIIFIDISRISNPPNLVAHAKSIDSVTDVLIRYLDLFFEKNYYSMKSIINNDQVFGIALHTSCLSNINGAFGHSSRITLKNLCSESSYFMNDLNFFAHSISRLYSQQPAT